MKGKAYVLDAEGVAALRALLTGSDRAGPDLTGVAGRRPSFFFDCWPGEIVALGPANQAYPGGQPAPSGPVYWVRRDRCTNPGAPGPGGGATDPATLGEYALNAAERPRWIVPATNLAEKASTPPVPGALPVGTYITVFSFWDMASEKRYWFSRSLDATFAVILTKDGGVAGGPAAECTYTYTVKNLAETVTLGTGLTPQRARAHFTEYWYAGATATQGLTSRYGLACRAANDDLVLLVAYGEIEKDTPCP
jgi:hypothetical protein